MLTDITKFNALRAEVAKYKERNKTLVFDYLDLQGNKDARSHVFKLRKMKTLVTDVHREVKAEALAACQAIDAEKRFLIGEVEGMIEVHAAPIKAIEQAKEQESLAKFRAKEEERLAEEARKQKELEDREAEVARKEAEYEAREAALYAEQEKVRFEKEREERDKRIVKQAIEDAAKQAETKAEAEKQAVKDAAAKTIADAKAKALAKENARLAKEAAEKAEKERLAAIERKRIENSDHRIKIEDAAIISLNQILDDFDNDFDTVREAREIVIAIRNNLIDNVTINY